MQLTDERRAMMDLLAVEVDPSGFDRQSTPLFARPMKLSRVNDFSLDENIS